MIKTILKIEMYRKATVFDNNPVKLKVNNKK